MQTHLNYRRLLEIGGVAFGLIVAPAMLPAQELDGAESFGVSKVVPPNLNVYGNTYGEWSAVVAMARVRSSK